MCQDKDLVELARIFVCLFRFCLHNTTERHQWQWKTECTSWPSAAAILARLSGHWMPILGHYFPPAGPTGLRSPTLDCLLDLV